MSSTGNVRVHGGIIGDQMLSGSLRYFTLAGADFTDTLGDGSFRIVMDYGEGLTDEDRTFKTIDVGEPVPLSAAEKALWEVMKKASIAVVGLGTEAPGATVKVDFALENTGMGWETYSMVDGSVTEDAATAIQNAIQALGTVNVYDGVVGTLTGTVDLSGATVVEKTFVLA